MPRMEIQRSSFRYEIVLDITQSMNARDYRVSGWPEDRLGFAKAAIEMVLAELPCGSEVGLGLFTTQSVHFLFEPIEICQHFPVIVDTLRHIDWRMAWSADTHVESGIYHAIRELAKFPKSTRLVFLTDGQETPPQSLKPQFDPATGKVQGILMGVGGRTPVSVPRLDRDNRILGIWENADIEKPPVSSTVYSEKVETRSLPTEGPYLTYQDEAHLKEIAAMTGLGFLSLGNVHDLSSAMLNPALSEFRESTTDLRPWLVGCALLLSLLTLLIEFTPQRRRL